MKKFIPLTCFFFFTNFLAAQNNFEVLIDWDGGYSSTSGLMAQEDREGNFYVLSNNQKYYPNPHGILIEGDLTFGTGITKVSNQGEIFWKKNYLTNGPADLNAYGRVPTTLFLIKPNDEIILPFSKYVGYLSCNNLGGGTIELVSHSFKKSMLQINTNSEITNENLYPSDSLCDRDEILAIHEWEDFYYLLYQEKIREQIIVEKLDKNFEVITANTINLNSPWLFFDEVDHQIIGIAGSKLLFFDLAGNQQKEIVLEQQTPILFPKVRVVASENVVAIMYSRYTPHPDEKASSIVRYDKNTEGFSTAFFPQKDFTDIALTKDDNILILSDNSKGDFHDTIAQALRVSLFDSNWSLIGEKNLGAPFIHPNSLSVSSDNGFLITGTRLKSIDLINGKEPDQIYFCKESIADLITETKEVKNLSGISVFPNPSDSRLFIRMSDGDAHTPYSLKLLDAWGRVVLSQQNGQGDREIDMTQYPAGIYFIHLQNKEGESIFTQQIAKN